MPGEAVCLDVKFKGTESLDTFASLNLSEGLMAKETLFYADAGLFVVFLRRFAKNLPIALALDLILLPLDLPLVGVASL